MNCRFSNYTGIRIKTTFCITEINLFSPFPKLLVRKQYLHGDNEKKRRYFDGTIFISSKSNWVTSHNIFRNCVLLFRNGCVERLWYNCINGFLIPNGSAEKFCHLNQPDSCSHCISMLLFMCACMTWFDQLPNLWIFSSRWVVGCFLMRGWRKNLKRNILEKWIERTRAIVWLLKWEQQSKWCVIKANRKCNKTTKVYSAYHAHAFRLVVWTVVVLPHYPLSQSLYSIQILCAQMRRRACIIYSINLNIQMHCAHRIKSND